MVVFPVAVCLLYLADANEPNEEIGSRGEGYRHVLPRPQLTLERAELLEHLWVWPALALLHAVHKLYHAFVHRRRHTVS